MAMRRVWLGGVALGALVVGPGLRPGGLLSLDLVVGPRIPVPPEVWGTGPEFPRRIPYGIVLAWLSRLVGGPVVMKATIVLAVAAAFAGAYRLAAATPVAARIGAGLVYAVSPFMLTRIGAGHVGLLLAVAALPWALPWVLNPNDDPRRALRWATVLGLTGFAGGTFALLALALSLVFDRGRRWARTALIAVVSQLSWVVPGLVAAFTLEGVRAVGGFETRAGALLDVVAGQGFWREGSQVGFATVPSAVMGTVLLVLAVIGWRELPGPWRARATALAAIAFVLVVAGGIPGLDAVYRALTSRMPGLLVRESHRLLALFLVWLAPAAAAGATRIGRGAARARPVYLAVPAVVAAVLAAPGLWGIEGRLDPVDYPDGWARMRAAVRRQPGPVFGLPWHRYMDISFADGRRVLNPLPDYLEGDVITSFDPELAPGGEEGADPRARALAGARRRLQEGQPIAADLRREGVRWVVLLHEVDWRRDRALGTDPGLETVVSDRAVELYRVRDWRAVATGREADWPLPAGLVLAGYLVTLSVLFTPVWIVAERKSLRYRHSERLITES